MMKSVEGSKNTTLVLIGFSLFYFAALLYMWFATNGLPGMKDQTESFTTYIAANNFKDYGIVNLSFLEDYATSPDPKAHPYHYTHNPDFPIYASYILLQIGVGDVKYHNLVAILVLFSGLLFSYLFIKSRFGTTLGLCVLGISVFNYLGVLIFGLNIYRSFTWPCVWGVLLFKHRWEESGAGLNARLFWAIFFMFLTVYFDYGIAAFVILIIALDKLFNRHRLRLYKLALYLFFSVVPSFVLHLASVISAIGWGTFSRDIVFTIGNRMCGFPPRQAIADFYRANHLVLWGYNEKINLHYVQYAIKLFYERVSTTIGPGTVELALVWLLAAIWMQVKHSEKLSRFKSDYRDEAKMLLTLFLAMLGVAFVLPAHFVQLYLHPFAPMVIFFIDFPRALTFGYICHGIEHFKQSNMRYLFKILFVVGIIIVLTTQLLNLRREAIHQIPASNVLSKYKGSTFYSNYLSTYTTYFTRNWSGTRWEPITEHFFNKEYLFEADKLPGVDKYNFPDYVLCIDSNNVNPCAVSEKFYNAYPVTDEGDDFIIFDVRSRNTQLPKVEEPKKCNVAKRLGGSADFKRNGVYFPNISMISASSTLGSHVPQNLLDNNPDTVWHKSIDDKKRRLRQRWGTLILDTGASIADWVEIDFGEGRMYAIDTIAALPNKAMPDQFFHNMIIRGSHDGKSWVDVACVLQPSVPSPTQWVTWQFKNQEEFRYYRLIMLDGFAENMFYSLADLRLGSRNYNKH
jgi:hypothetical protein